VIRFYPLKDAPRDGILTIRGKPFVAAFWTPEEAKAVAKSKRRAF
jgi:hypothetical protein